MADPANPVLFMTDDEIRARLVSIRERMPDIFFDLDDDDNVEDFNFMYNVIDARLPSLTERERADDEARRE